MAMKVNELMVGDWVNMGNPVTDELVPTKIENIYGEEINCKTDHTSDDVPTIIYGEWLRYAQPIPLTEDILEKNSIKISSFTGTLYWFDEDEHCCVKPIENRFMFMYSKGADYLTFRITYVHQLQHLLRLVGIEKEIEL